ncbi:hypothetical protein [Falsiroseomonas sp. E2-1-a20]|uniref:hypothetical protein n=1 Tax=Falsiroseomonas sp. E2-1-a20 TaxID=3239300 RepID=UPI003F2DAC8D
MDVDDVAVSALLELLRRDHVMHHSQFLRFVQRLGRRRAIDLRRVRSGRSCVQADRRVDPLRRTALPFDAIEISPVSLEDEGRDRWKLVVSLLPTLSPAERRAVSRYVAGSSRPTPAAERQARHRATRRLRAAVAAIEVD